MEAKLDGAENETVICEVIVNLANESLTNERVK